VSTESWELHRDGGYGNLRTRYWHTTAVFRLSATLEVGYHPGRANELDESEY
jgi:hypothetical protein